MRPGGQAELLVSEAQLILAGTGVLDVGDKDVAELEVIDRRQLVLVVDDALKFDRIEALAGDGVPEQGGEARGQAEIDGERCELGLAGAAATAEAADVDQAADVEIEVGNLERTLVVLDRRVAGDTVDRQVIGLRIASGRGAGGIGACNITPSLLASRSQLTVVGERSKPVFGSCARVVRLNCS